MRTYIFLLVISTTCSYALTLALSRSAWARSWTRREGGSAAEDAVPRLGGVAVLLTTLLAVALLMLWDNEVAVRLSWKMERGLGLLFAAGAVFVLGLYDDLRGARPWQKLLVQIAAGVGLYVAGFRVELLTNPFTQNSMELGWWSLPVTLLWLVAISNAFNLIDGLDGLAAGVGLFSTLSLFLLAMMVGDSFVAAIAVALAGSLAGFLPHNFNPARIYLGDSGSLTVGLTLAALAIASAQKGSVLITVAIPLMIFGLPLLDVSVTTARRFLSGHPIFKRDEEHLHHRLVKIGLTKRRAVLVLYGVTALFAVAAMGLIAARGTTAPVIALICGVLAWLLVGQMQYPEFTELDSHVRLALRSQRQLLRNQILLRKSTNQARGAATEEELWQIACLVFATLDFDFAECEIHVPGVAGGRTLTWQENSASRGAWTIDEKYWTFAVPLVHDGRAIAQLRLGRSLEKGVILFRVSSLLEFASTALSPQLSILIAQNSCMKATLAEAS